MRDIFNRFRNFLFNFVHANDVRKKLVVKRDLIHFIIENIDSQTKDTFQCFLLVSVCVSAVRLPIPTN